MHRNETEQAVTAVRETLAQVAAYLASRASRIGTAWQKLLKRYKPCDRYVAQLTALRLAQRLREVSSANPKAYWTDSKRQGHELASQGVPVECAAVSVSLYFKSCLTYLNADGSQSVKWTKALARWASVYQHHLLSGYSQFIRAQNETSAERIHLAEKRSLDFSIQLGDAYEKERRRLAQDLHDEIGHDLIVLKLYTQLLALDLKKGETSQLRGKLKEALSLINHALKGVRHLTFDLGPAVWSEQGFLPAVRLYSRQYSRRTGIKVRVNARRLRGPLPSSYETALYKVIQGALSNAAAHSDARHVQITLAARQDAMYMQVEDDGKGFNVTRKLKAPPRSYGLRAMRDRIELLGGRIRFESWPRRAGSARHGTLIECELPLLQEDMR